MKIAICLSEVYIRKKIILYLDKISKDYSIDLTYDIYKDPNLLVNPIIKIYNMLIIDINLHFYNGFKIAKKIRYLNNVVSIIFISSILNYAICGYEVSAYRFLIPSISYNHFFYQLKDLFLTNTKIRNDFITIKSNGININLSIYDIYYIEVINHRIYYYCEN